VAGVQLDSGEDSLTGRSSGSKGSGIGKRGSASIGKRGSAGIGKRGSASISESRETGIGSSDSWDSMSNVSNDGTRGSSINTTEKTGTNTISTSIWVGKDSRGGDSSNLISITPLSLLSNSYLRGGGGSSSGGSISNSKFSLGGSNLRSVFNSNWEGEVENGSNKGGDSSSNRGNGEVGSGYSESVNGISNVVDSLQETVSINVLVGAGGHSIGIAGLSTG